MLKSGSRWNMKRMDAFPSLMYQCVGEKMILRIYRKPTHTNRYLNWNSFHHPNHIISVADSLVRRAIQISDPNYVEEELNFISKILMENNFPQNQTKYKINELKSKLINNRPVEPSMQLILNTALIECGDEQIEPTSATKNNDEYRTALKYLGPTSHEISRILWKDLKWKTTFYPGTKTKILINSVKEKRNTEHGGVYRVKCATCSSIYIGETIRDLDVRLKEHQDACRLNHTKKSAIAKHYRSFKCNHIIDWEGATIFKKEDRTYLRKLYEHIYISQAKSSLMNPNSGMKIPDVWSKSIPQLPPQ